jgi:hypothetical protein
MAKPTIADVMAEIQGVRWIVDQMANVTLAGVKPPPPPHVAPLHKEALARVTSWDIAPTGPDADLVVCEGSWAPEAVVDLKIADGRRRFVLSLVSLAEPGAETGKRDWWDIVALKIKVAQAEGFDGVCLADADAYLDKIDWTATREKATAEAVISLAHYAKARGGQDFVVFLGNAPELIPYPGVLEVIDGAVHEDLFYGIADDGRPNAQSYVDDVTALLRRVNGPILVLEHDLPAAAAPVARRLGAVRGFKVAIKGAE